jgi:hypothetical protein
LLNRKLTISLIVVASLGVLLAACTRETQKQPITLEPSIEGSLEPVHPDETVSETYGTRFSLENALTRANQTKELGKSLTGESAMALTNAVGAIKGTLMKQNYEIKKLEFELAKWQLREAQITQEVYDQKKANYEKAAADFVAFWDEFGISD